MYSTVDTIAVLPNLWVTTYHWEAKLGHPSLRDGPFMEVPTALLHHGTPKGCSPYLGVVLRLEGVREAHSILHKPPQCKIKPRLLHYKHFLLSNRWLGLHPEAMTDWFKSLKYCLLFSEQKFAMAITQTSLHKVLIGGAK